MEEEMDDKEIIARAGKPFGEASRCQREGELEEAIRLYRASIRCHPTSEAYTFLGWSLSFQGHYEEAIEECKKAIAVDPDFGNPYNDIGAYLINLGGLDEAIPWLGKGLRAARYEGYPYPP